MLGQNIRVGLAELMEQPRRAFDVREQERDRPRGQACHARIMRRAGEKV